MWTALDPTDDRRPLKRLGHQHQFAASTSTNTYLAGGWGSGKSIAGLAFIDDSLWDNPGCTGIVMQPTHRLLREFVETQLRPAFKRLIVGESKTDGILYLPGGRRIICLSGHVLDRLELYNAAWGYIDEGGLLKREVFTRMAARLRDARASRIRLGITGTPHYGWLRDEFDGRHDDNRSIIHVRTADNPHLHRDYIENLMASCPARMRKAYLEGHFVSSGGNVYPEWDPDDRHQIDWTYRPDRDMPIIPVVDWSPRTAHVQFWQLIPEGTEITKGVHLKKLHRQHEYAGAVLVDELIPDLLMDTTTTERLARMTLERAYPFSQYVCDPAGKAKEATSGKTNIRIFSQITGAKPLYKTKTGYRLITNGVEMVRNMLDPYDGVPRMYISRDLVERSRRLPDHLKRRATSVALQEYGYSPHVDGKPIDSNPIEDGVTEHAADDTRYLAVNFFPVARLAERVHVRAA